MFPTFSSVCCVFFIIVFIFVVFSFRYFIVWLLVTSLVSSNFP
jgi:hypothetical protein